MLITGREKRRRAVEFMRARIKSIVSSDVPNLESWEPQDSEDIYLPPELQIGHDDRDPVGPLGAFESERAN